ncbi:hypothetical protein JAAARDRAFT_170240 [Jaapia argillacea MUCL 33604]|uniref:F-box domain-containing protein n=1 Tax=Jaapia argillacea MUCL 33604 TaxID=933084 RepID=A0A067QHJ5_9AGAM|nr:hypothetical protein JAAARDRAFT_170240 [Jaapia argillacea MUCL 33604]
MAEPRRSTRLKAVPKPSVDANEKDTKDANNAPESNRSRKKKRTGAAVAKGMSRKRQGRLQLLPEMPLDILFEIFGQLMPMDLLRLSWTSKTLRSTLMSRSARSVWKQVLGNVPDLPPCPSDLTEAQYALLAFYPHCYYCGTPSVQTIAWYARVRSCKKCLKKYFVDASECFDMLPEDVADRLLDTVKWTNMLSKRYDETVYLASEILQVTEEVSPLVGNESALSEYITRREAQFQIISGHALLAFEWQDQQTAKRKEQRQEAYNTRALAISDRLEGLGYSEELLFALTRSPEIFIDDPLVNQPKELTERIWNNIKAPLISKMEVLRKFRINIRRTEVLIPRQTIVKQFVQSYVETFLPTRFSPSPADVCNMKPFKDIIELPSDVDVTFDDFMPIFEQLPELETQWRQGIERRLVRLVKGAPSDNDTDGPDTACLDLATTWFDCHICHDIISYPRVLFHKCMTAIDRRHPKCDVDSPHSPECIIFCRQRETLGGEPWDVDGTKLTYHQEASNLTRDFILDVCGMDPEVTTLKDMDALDHRFLCGICPANGPRVATWASAIWHMLRYHRGTAVKDHDWAILFGRRKILAKMLVRDDDSDEEVKPCSSYWCCSRCRTMRNFRNLALHIREVHGVEDVQPTDYYLYPDAPTHRPFRNVAFPDGEELEALLEWVE